MDKATIAHNKKLVARYPFLAPKVYDHEASEKDGIDRYIIDPEYDYSWTWLDGLPEGWVKAFGSEMCQEIWDELVRCDYLDDYTVVQTKEKFGSIRWYDGGIPKGCKVWDIIRKYEELSERTCCHCGKPATKISKGWICPWCDDCANKIGGQFWDIDEYMSPPEGE